jgi:hypothetical protein
MRILIIVFIGGIFCNQCYAQITRKELVNSTLDYYTLKTEAEKKAEEQKKKKEEIVKEEMKKAEERLAKIKNFLADLHPYLNVEETYDDNIYRLKTNKKSDFITKLFPGIQYRSKNLANRTNLILNGGWQIIKYADRNIYNDESPYANAVFARGLGRYNLGLSASAKKSTSISSTFADNPIERFIDSWNYDFNADLKTDFNRFDYSLQYNHSVAAYEDNQDKLNNNSQDAVAFRSAFKLLPKTKLFLEYGHGWHHYPKKKANGWDYDKYLVGLDGKIFAKLEGTIKSGYMTTKQRTGKDINGNVVDVNLSYNASPHLRYSLGLVQGLGDTALITGNVSRNRGITLGCDYFPPFNNKLSLKTGISYWQRHYSWEEREDVFGASFGPSYKFKKWLILGLSYKYEKKTSELKVNDYKSNVTTLTITSEF